MSDIKVGQKIWTLNSGNAARNCKQELTEREVTKVGRKYFYVGMGYHDAKFYIEDMREFTEYTSSYEIYLDPQTYYDEKECRELLTKIKGLIFPQYGRADVELDKVRKIAEILGIEV